MPDNQAESATPAVNEQAPAPESQTPQQESREALYQKLYGSQQTQQPTTTEQVQQTTQEPDYKTLFTQLSSQVQQLIEKQSAPAAEPAKPAAPQEDWFSLLQQGKRTEAEQVLKDYVAQGAQQKIIQETLVQAMELNRMEREIEDFNNSVRASNSDMLDVEDLVSLRAEKEFAKLPVAKNNKEYVDNYKKAVTTSLDAIRNVMRRTRAAAKNEAMTVRRDVLASTTMSPNDITRREETAGQQQPPDETQMQSPTDYLAARTANYRRLSGVS